MLSIGQQLSCARSARDLTIEDVAFQTRIPAARVRDMENDDLSPFANLTYARGFLKIYSQFLEVDISDYLEQFSTADLARASGHEYVQMANATQNLPAAVFTDYGRARRPGLYILLALALAGGAVFWWNQWGQPDDSPGPGKVAEVPASTPSISPVVTPDSENQPSVPALPAATENPATPVPEPESAAPTNPSAAPPGDSRPPRATVVEEDEETPNKKKERN